MKQWLNPAFIVDSQSVIFLCEVLHFAIVGPQLLQVPAESAGAAADGSVAVVLKAASQHALEALRREAGKFPGLVVKGASVGSVSLSDVAEDRLRDLVISTCCAGTSRS